MAVAHGGQMVFSGATAALVAGELPDGVRSRRSGRASAARSAVVDARVPGGGTRLAVVEFPPLRSLDALPGNLPRQVTTFVGREAEIASLADLVRESSLVTLTGVGGVGKTRLALQVAAEVVTDFPDGAWLCEFAPVTDPGAVWETLAASLRVQAFPGRTLEESVLEYLAAKRLLLVLDNCEHLLDAIARQVDAIAQRCARVSVLATSREGLALAGERIVAVPSLGVPADDADRRHAHRRGRGAAVLGSRDAAKNDFALTDRNASAVGVLCRRLDGIPLAIELAAARVRSLSPEDLVARLDQRFKLLTRGSRAALERHQTLRSTIDWSYDLLDPTERRALDRLSVFAGSCDLAAAEAVLASDDARRVRRGRRVGPARRQVARRRRRRRRRRRALPAARDHPPIRAGTTPGERRDRRGPPPPRRPLRRAWPRRPARTCGAGTRSSGPQPSLRDTDNFRAALDWAVETPSPEHALRLVAPFTVSRHGRSATPRRTGPRPRARSRARRSAALSASRRVGRVGRDLRRRFRSGRSARRRAERGASDARHCELIRCCALGTSSRCFRGDLEQARDARRAWVDLARRVRRPLRARARAPHARGRAHGRSRRRDRDPRRGGARRPRRGHRLGALDRAFRSSPACSRSRNRDRALALLDEAIEVGLRVGDRRGVALAIGSKGVLAFRAR